MKRNITSSILLFSMVLALALISGSCRESNNEKTESADQQATPEDSVGMAALELKQPVTESAIKTESSEKSVPEKGKATANTANKQEGTPTAAKETGTPKNDVKPSGTSKTTSKAVEPDTGKSEAVAEQPKSDPVSPTKTIAEKEETKVVAPPQPVSEPAAEKPKEIIVAQPAVEEETKTTVPAAGNWIVPEKDNNKANPFKVDAESLNIGKSLYTKHCASCHGKKGLGDGSKAAQLDTPSGDFTLPAIQNQTDGALFYKTREGKGDMPEFKKKIPDEEDIWHIVNYIRTFK